jgi:hypothetical protein
LPSTIAAGVLMGDSSFTFGVLVTELLLESVARIKAIIAKITTTMAKIIRDRLVSKSLSIIARLSPMPD